MVVSQINQNPHLQIKISNLTFLFPSFNLLLYNLFSLSLSLSSLESSLSICCNGEVREQEHTSQAGGYVSTFFHSFLFYYCFMDRLVYFVYPFVFRFYLSVCYWLFYNEISSNFILDCVFFILLILGFNIINTNIV